ncbi:hypothetical protein [Dokdonia pacifica]|uniref:Lipoprotein n=1 Tax=Dokdonia pacifica TaxID=1627892 RepID=A0A238W959_9FLAO|nr:hypothetical protein [Dokdonia pacifica]SNR42824.1 hypothetical protein SAMN06265376_101801 [Dokdonia pacifica]
MKYTYSLHIAFISFLMLLGCSDRLEPEGSIENTIDSNKEEIEQLGEEIFERDSISVVERKKELIIKFYDKIGYKMIDRVLTDRVYKSSPENKIVLKSISLNEFNSKLKNGTESEKNVKLYVKSLVKYRDMLFLDLAKDSIYKGLDNILKSRFYIDTIVGKERISNELYIKLNDEIKANIDTLKNDIEELDLKGNQKPLENLVKEENGITIPDEGKNKFKKLIEFIKKQGLLFLILLLVSIILNILQYIFYKKKRRQLNSKLSKATEKLASIKTKPENKSDDVFKPKPSKLSDHIVKNKIENAYETMHKTLLHNYHRNCVEDQEVTYNTLLSDTIASARSERFTSEQELTSYISKQIQKHRALLESDIQECVSQDVAIQQIHARITTEDFLPTINTAIIPESEVRAKVQLLRQNLINELPLTTTQEVLSGIINDFKQSIETHLHKMLQENLVFYFPFADVRGALSDEKKSKTKARDSALQLSLSPDNVTQATFHLLLDQEQMMQAGIMSYDSLLLPICELKPENFNSSGTRIEEIGTQGGTMTLEDGKWRVKDKLPIKIV